MYAQTPPPVMLLSLLSAAFGATPRAGWPAQSRLFALSPEMPLSSAGVVFQSRDTTNFSVTDTAPEPATCLMDAQGLSAFHAGRGVMYTLLEDCIFAGGPLRSHLIGFSAETGALVANVSSLPLLPSESGYVGAGQCVAVDEHRDAVFLIGRDHSGTAKLWRTDLASNVTMAVGVVAGVASGIDLLLQGCALDPTTGVLWATLPMGDNATAYAPSLIGVSTTSSRVLHRLDVYTPYAGPAAIAFDAHRGMVVGIGISVDPDTHSMNGSTFFEISDSHAGTMGVTTLRAGVLPPSVVAVLGAVATVDAAGRVFYFECIVAPNTTAVQQQHPLAAPRSESAAWGAIVTGSATQRGTVGGQPSRVGVRAPTVVPGRGSVLGLAAQPPLTGLCALDAHSGAFKFARGVCTEMAACPWNLQYWNN